VLTVFSVILIGATGAHAERTVRGDAAAWNEMVAAFQRLGGLSAHRDKRTLGSGTIVMEIVPPHSYHAITQTGAGTVESVNVSGQARYRTTGASGVPGGCGVRGASLQISPTP
jgi:hypothetical protein